MTTITIDRATVEQALEALESVLCDPEGKCCIDGSDADRAVVDKALAALRAALAQQAEPVAFDWPRKACPCRDVQHGECTTLGCKWERDPSLVPEALRRQAGMQQAESVQEPVESVTKVAAAQVEAERERIFAHIRSAMGHAEAGYDDVAWKLLAWLVGPNVGVEPHLPAQEQK